MTDPADSERLISSHGPVREEIRKPSSIRPSAAPSLDAALAEWDATDRGFACRFGVVRLGPSGAIEVTGIRHDKFKAAIVLRPIRLDAGKWIRLRWPLPSIYPAEAEALLGLFEAACTWARDEHAKGRGRQPVVAEKDCAP